MAHTSSGPVLTWRGGVEPARWGLRTYWGTAVLLASTAATALATLMPVAALLAPGAGLAPRLSLPPWRGGDLGMTWSTLAWTPTSTRAAALVTLFHLLLGLAIGVLAVAGLTIISLSAVRTSARAPEVSLRRAVGASRRDLSGAALVESGAIAAVALLFGGLAGTLVARSATAAWPGGLGPTTPVAPAVATLAALVGIFLGALLPLAFPRHASPLPPSRGKPLELLVPAVQLGLSLAALTAAALVQRRAGPLVTPGSTTAAEGDVFRVTGPQTKPSVRARQYDAMLRQLGAQPGVDAVSLSSPGTLVGLGMVDVVITDCGACTQGGLPFPLQPVPATHYLVSADTFRVLGLRVTSGRFIAPADRWNTLRVAVVNRSLAARHFQRGGPVGRKIMIRADRGEWYTVVGVVDDQQPLGFGAGLQPPFAVYLSVLQQPAPRVDLLVQAPRRTATTTTVERRLRETLGPESWVRDSRAQLVAAELAPLEWFGRMFGSVGWAILAIATLGTFAIMHLWARSLWYELGLRRAVGARRRHIVGFILLRTAGVAVGGVALGLWFGLFVWGSVAAVVAGMPQWDVPTALRIAPLLVVASLAGALLPTWHAARATPTSLVQAASD